MGNGERRGRLTVQSQYDHGQYAQQMRALRAGWSKNRAVNEREAAERAAQSGKPEDEDGPAGLVDEGKIEE